MGNVRNGEVAASASIVPSAFGTETRLLCGHGGLTARARAAASLPAIGRRSECSIRDSGRRRSVSPTFLVRFRPRRGIAPPPGELRQGCFLYGVRRSISPLSLVSVFLRTRLAHETEKRKRRNRSPHS